MQAHASGSKGFPRAARLLNAADFRYVFGDACRVSDNALTLLARTGRQGRPRLGLAISRRAVPRAVDRNRIKRLCRESFRQRRSTLPAIDVVILARPPARGLDTGTLHRRLDMLWARLIRRCSAS